MPNLAPTTHELIQAHAIIQADALLLQMGPEAFLALAVHMVDQAQHLQHEELIVTPTGRTLCPHCVAEVDEADSLIVQDLSLRDTYAHEWEGGAPVYVYEGGADFDTLYYRCAHCSRPVDLPEGVQEISQ